MSLAIIILAAGKGVRMNSTLPKVLHKIGGTTILGHIINTVGHLSPEKIIVVYGHEGEKLIQSFSDHPQSDSIAWIEQTQQLGTGHAVLQALPALGKVDRALILYGDIPLISLNTLEHLLKTTPISEIGLITEQVADPAGLGRIVRNAQGKVQKIVEEKDATPEEKEISEINTGFFVVPAEHLKRWLPQLTAENQQKEYYLPEIIHLANTDGFSINTISPHFEWEVLGVNDKIQLATLERIFQNEVTKRFMQQGVTFLDPTRFDIRAEEGDITLGRDVVIDINVILEGRVSIGNNVKIGPNVTIKNSTVQDNTVIHANSVIEGATIGPSCQIGPFARIRPGTVLAEEVHVGSFVEIKKSTIGPGSKANHLSYLGDAEIGKDVNVGAGTITCNYDGKNKHKTIIKDRVFIGSDTQLIAPVTVYEDVTIGAGTTITHDVPANHMVHNRIEHRLVKDWKPKE